MPSWPRNTAVWRNAGSSSTRSIASRRPSVRSISSGSSRVTETKAFKRLCRTAFACEADAQQALTRFAAGLQTTFLHDSTVCPAPHSGKRGRPGPGAQPAQLVYHTAGALASRLTDHRARVDHQSCFILATNELDEGQ